MRMHVLSWGLILSVGFGVAVGDEKDDFRKTLFGEFDLNKDGKIDELEKAKAAEKMGQQLQGRIPEEMMKKVDRNGDGRIDQQEALAAQALLQQLQQRGAGGPPQFGAGGPGGGIGGFGGETGGFGGSDGPVPPDVLKKFDKNKDGKLDEKERKAATEAMAGVKKSRAQLTKEKLDLDGDGKVTKEEKAAYQEQLKAEKEEKKEEKKSSKLKKSDD